MVAEDWAKAVLAAANVARAATLLIDLSSKELIWKLSLYGFTAFQNRLQIAALEPKFQVFDTVISNVQNSVVNAHFERLNEVFMNELC